MIKFTIILSTILKTSKNSWWSIVVWYVYMYSERLFNTLYYNWDKTQMLKKFFQTKETLLQLITILFLIRDSYTSWSTRFISQKFSVSSRFCQSLYFCSTKSMDCLTLKRHNSFQSKNNRKVTHGFAPRLLIFKLQQKVLKLKDICLSWSFPKTDQETSFLNLENRSFEYITFSL